MPRTSARSAAKAKSPPKPQIRPRARVTRSQSVELGNITSPPRITRSTAREASAGSTINPPSASSRTAGQLRRTAEAAVDNELSIVQEDIEAEDSDYESSEADEIENLLLSPDDNEEAEEAADEDAENPVLDNEDNGEKTPDRDFGNDSMRSPGALSGTTAYTVNQSRLLDPVMAVNFLPDLHDQSTKMLELFVPADVTEAGVTSCVNKVRISGTPLARLLQGREHAFNVTKELYSNDAFLNPGAVNLSILGTQKPVDIPLRPDAIIQKANLAILVKDFITSVKGSEDWHTQIFSLHSVWPRPFFGSFEKSDFGSTSLRKEAFDMGLEIRTMCTIVALHELRDEADVTKRDEDAAGCFYSPPGVRDESKPYLDDVVTNGRIREMFTRSGGEICPNLNEEDQKLKERFQIIRSCFRDSDDAMEGGDIVDFEELDDQFPWLSFLTHLVGWTRLRMNEIDKTIQEQGGVQQITRYLAQLGDSQPDSIPEEPLVAMEKPPAEETRSLLPAPPISESGNVQSSINKDTMKLILPRRRNRSRIEPPRPTQRSPSVGPSSRQAPVGQVSVRGQSSTDVQQDDQDQWLVPLGGEDDEITTQEPPSSRPISAYTEAWKISSQYKNKENLRPTEPTRNQNGKRRLIDPQENAERIQWDSQDSPQRQPKRLRRADSEDEESEDGGFQEDRRNPDPARRAAAPPGRVRTPVPASMPSNRQQQEDDRTGQEEAERNLQASARHDRGDSDDDEEEEEEEEEEEDEDEAESRPSFTQIRGVANANKVRASVTNQIQNKQRQYRTPWTEHDEELLVDYIRQYGISWKTIAALPGWEIERPNFQVQCKDKARNMKVAYIRAGARLPLNFHLVPLGRKEILRIQAIHPDYIYDRDR